MGYRNLHTIDSPNETTAPDTGAVLKYGAKTWGFLTLIIDRDTIQGVSTEVGPDGEVSDSHDTFSYTAKPLKLADGKSVPTL